MKIKQLATAALGALALCGGMAFESNKAQAQAVNLACVEAGGGEFVTTVSNGRVTRSLITWNSNAFSYNSGWTPENLCHAVTQRFNRVYETQVRLRLSTGTINGLGVICGLEGRDRRCNNDNIIITLNPGINPRAALRDLIDLMPIDDGYRTLLSLTTSTPSFNDLVYGVLDSD